MRRGVGGMMMTAAEQEGQGGRDGEGGTATPRPPLTHTRGGFVFLNQIKYLGPCPSKMRGQGFFIYLLGPPSCVRGGPLYF